MGCQMSRELREGVCYRGGRGEPVASDAQLDGLRARRGHGEPAEPNRRPLKRARPLPMGSRRTHCCAEWAVKVVRRRTRARLGARLAGRGAYHAGRGRGRAPVLEGRRLVSARVCEQRSQSTCTWDLVSCCRHGRHGRSWHRLGLERVGRGRAVVSIDSILASSRHRLRRRGLLMQLNSISANLLEHGRNGVGLGLLARRGRRRRSRAARSRDTHGHAWQCVRVLGRPVQQLHVSGHRRHFLFDSATTKMQPIKCWPRRLVKC